MPPKHTVAAVQQSDSLEQSPQLPEQLRVEGPTEITTPVTVQWALPTIGLKDHSPNVTYAARFAHRLYQRPWSSLQAEQTPFGFSRIRTPVFQRAGKNLTTVGDNSLNRIQFVSLFNQIKEDTLSAAGRARQATFTSDRIREALLDTGDDVAVILSRSGSNSILQLDRDYRVQVNLSRHGQLFETSEMTFRRIVAPATTPALEDARTEFFIELPPNTRVTVNDVSYFNRVPEENGGVAGPLSPFFIGPLHPYTVVEFLSQPLFFFRNGDGLRFTQKVGGKQNELSADEQRVRDARGFAEGLEVEILWTPVVNAPPTAPELPSENPPNLPQTGDDNFQPSTKTTDNNQKTAKTKGNDQPATGVDNGQPFPIYEQSPCAYLRECLERLKEQFQSGHSSRILNEETVLHCIRAVAQAVNRRSTADTRVNVVQQDSLNAAISDSIDSNGSVFIPWASRSYTMLVVLHRIQSTGNITYLHVIDSAPWTHGPGARARLHSLLANAVNESGVAPNVDATQWAFCARQSDLWHAAYYTVLNAWSITFGMQLSPSFRPSPDFFDEAWLVFQAAVAGYADWKLIWSFLQCHKFATSQQPVERFQFEMTSEGLEEPLAGSSGSAGDSLTTAIETLEQLRHSDDFPWDDWEDQDADLRLPAIYRAGLQFNTMPFPREKLRAVYDTIKGPDTQRTLEDFPSDVRYWAYVKEQLKKLLVRQKTKSLIRILTETGFTTEIKRFLHEDDVSTAIASVTQAITATQDIAGGFCSIPQQDVQDSQLYVSYPEDDSIVQLSSAVRFGRPIIVPLLLDSHIVLLVVQQDNEGTVQTAVWDSKAYHYKNAEREIIHRMIRAIIQHTGWWRHTFEKFEDVTFAKSSTQWIPCAQQSGSAECGYHVIMNAWAIALGLLPNVNFNPIWYTEEDGETTQSTFLQDLQSIIKLARVGLADWKLIYAFLRCHHFAHEGNVPNDRRFGSTVAMMSESSLKSHIAALRMEEKQYWTQTKLSTANLQSFRQTNQTLLGPGRDHNDPKRFISDTWDKVGDVVVALDLARDGRLRLHLEKANLRRYEIQRRRPDGKSAPDHAKTHAVKFRASLLKPLKNLSRDQINSRCADFAQAPGTNAFLVHQIQNFPQPLSTELSLFGYGITIHQDTQGAFADLQFPAVPDSARLTLLTDLQVVHAISAVTQAIDDHQTDYHRRFNEDFIFGSGLALASYNDIANSRDFDDATINNTTMHTSRPRRCWLLPMTVASNEIWKFERRYQGSKNPAPSELRAHTFLAVLQEETRSQVTDGQGEDAEEVDTVDFRMYFLDSSGVFNTRRNALYQMVVNTAYNMSWATHRNQPSEADPELAIREFSTELSIVKVAQQTQGGWACGYHTILNAWILALRLTPNPEHRYTLDDYIMIARLSRSAVAGLLNWKDLVAWLFWRRAVMERDIREVYDDRRFALSACQAPRGEQLEQYVQAVRTSEEEEEKTSGSLNEVPYVHESNIDWYHATIESFVCNAPVVPQRAPPTIDTEIDVTVDTSQLNESGSAVESQGGRATSPTEADIRLMQEMYGEDDRNQGLSRAHDDPGLPEGRTGGLKRSYEGESRIPRKRIRFDSGDTLGLFDVKSRRALWRADLSFLHDEFSMA